LPVPYNQVAEISFQDIDYGDSIGENIHAGLDGHFFEKFTIPDVLSPPVEG